VPLAPRDDWHCRQSIVIEQLRGEILARGLISEPQLKRDLEGLGGDDFAFPSPILWAAWGRKN
jgi:hypothetical protein